jgi:Fe2+ transport system protein FeoA
MNAITNTSNQTTPNQATSSFVASQTLSLDTNIATQTKSQLPLSNIGKILASKALGGLGRFLDGVASAHENLDNTPLVHELKKKFSHPLAIRAFSEVNLAFLKGCINNLQDYKESNNQDNSNLNQKNLFSIIGKLFSAEKKASDEVSKLINDLKIAEKKLLRDLAVDICDKSSKEVLLKGLTDRHIRNIVPINLPKIEKYEDFIAYQIIILGSAIGATIQYKRQNNSYGLNSSINGGAEYLASAGNAPIQVLKLFNLSRRVESTLNQKDSLDKAIDTGNQIFKALTDLFNISYETKFCSVSSLKDCARGTTGTVHRVVDADKSSNRLSEMGFVSGSRVVVRQNNGYGIIVEVAGSQYALNATYARAIHIVVD